MPHCKNRAWQVLKKITQIQQFHLLVFTQNSKDSNRYLHTYIHCSAIPNSQKRKPPKCPSVGGWISKSCPSTQWSIIQP